MLPSLVAEPARAQRLQGRRQREQVDRERAGRRSRRSASPAREASWPAKISSTDALLEVEAGPERVLVVGPALEALVHDLRRAEQRDVVALGVQPPEQRQELVPVERQVADLVALVVGERPQRRLVAGERRDEAPDALALEREVVVGAGAVPAEVREVEEAVGRVAERTPRSTSCVSAAALRLVMPSWR